MSVREVLITRLVVQSRTAERLESRLTEDGSTKTIVTARQGITSKTQMHTMEAMMPNIEKKAKAAFETGLLSGLSWQNTGGLLAIAFAVGIGDWSVKRLLESLKGTSDIHKLFELFNMFAKQVEGKFDRFERAQKLALLLELHSDLTSDVAENVAKMMPILSNSNGSVNHHIQGLLDGWIASNEAMAEIRSMRVRGFGIYFTILVFQVAVIRKLEVRQPETDVLQITKWAHHWNEVAQRVVGDGSAYIEYKKGKLFAVNDKRVVLVNHPYSTFGGSFTSLPGPVLPGGAPLLPPTPKWFISVDGHEVAGPYQTSEGLEPARLNRVDVLNHATQKHFLDPAGRIVSELRALVQRTD